MMPPGSRENLALSCVVFVRTKCRVVDGEYGILVVSSLFVFSFVCIYYDFVLSVCIHPICNAFFFSFSLTLLFYSMEYVVRKKILQGKKKS
jgi:hypothetical protein